MSTEPLNEFQTARELRDNQDQADTEDAADGWSCVNGYHRCPGPDNDRLPCDDCRIIGHLLDDETVGGLGE